MAPGHSFPAAVARLVRVPATHLAELRRRLDRTPLARRVLRRQVVAAAAAVVIGASVVSVMNAANRTRARWGPTQPVLVARRDLAPGTALGPEDVAVRQWPTALLPAAVVRHPDDRRTRRDVAAGAPLTDTDLAAPARGAVAARLDRGRVGVTMGRGAAPAPVRPGDVVDLIGLTSGDGRTLGGRTLARRALVVAADDRTVTVAVSRDEAPTAAAAGATGTVALVLLP